MAKKRVRKYQLVKALMATRGLTENDLAEATGKSQPLVSQWISGQRKPRPEDAAKVSRLLGMEGLFTDEVQRGN